MMYRSVASLGIKKSLLYIWANAYTYELNGISLNVNSSLGSTWLCASANLLLIVP